VPASVAAEMAISRLGLGLDGCSTEPDGEDGEWRDADVQIPGTTCFLAAEAYVLRHLVGLQAIQEQR
jgi:hypothetical protein